MAGFKAPTLLVCSDTFPRMFFQRYSSKTLHGLIFIVTKAEYLDKSRAAVAVVNTYILYMIMITVYKAEKSTYFGMVERARERRRQR